MRIVKIGKKKFTIGTAILVLGLAALTLLIALLWAVALIIAPSPELWHMTPNALGVLLTLCAVLWIGRRWLSVPAEQGTVE